MRKLLAVLVIITFLFSTSTLAESQTVIFGNNVNFRSSPSTSDDNIITQLHHGQTVSVLQTFNTLDMSWSYVSLENNLTGYVASQYIGTSYTGTAAMTTADVNMRQGPDTNYPSYGVVPKYAILKIIDTWGEWSKVQYAGKVGYMANQYLYSRTFENEELLGSYTTDFSSSAKGRSNNIKKAAFLINEYIVAPGDTFSLLSAIGPITKEGGYFEAPEYRLIDGVSETVTGYGGGVCQIASTLYQSVYASINSGSNINIVERHHHSKSVSYIKDGQDATISWSGKKDFKFRNDNIYSIKIRTYITNGTLSCMIFKVNI